MTKIGRPLRRIRIQPEPIRREPAPKERPAPAPEPSRKEPGKEPVPART